MKILVYGAGVIGTLYGARLQNAGHQVTILARASRLANIRRHGLVLEDVVTGVHSATPVAVAERLSVDEGYDMALVSVRRDQLSGILPDLVRAGNISSVLFMLNNPSAPPRWPKLSDRIVYCWGFWEPVARYKMRSFTT